MIVEKFSNADAKPFTTKDGSTIREFLHPSWSGNKEQSLAEATLPPGMATQPHRHHVTEELYYITHGEGLMTLGHGEPFPVQPGDTVLIIPGTRHTIENTGQEDLRFLCCCAPAYSHDDTELED